MVRKVKRSMFAHIFEYEYFIEKTGKYLLAIIFVSLVVVLGGWYESIMVYTRYPTSTGFFYLGLSLSITVLILLSTAAAFMLPYFIPALRPKGFRKPSDYRSLYLSLVISLVLLGIGATIMFLAGLTNAFRPPFI